MPIWSTKITNDVARQLPAPQDGAEKVLWMCPAVPRFGVSVHAKGARSWFFETSNPERREKTFRRTLGPATGAKAMTRADALRARAVLLGQIEQGQDPIAVARREKAAAQAEDEKGVTLAQAVREYAEKKRRAKDGLPLKQRTKIEYLKMVQPGNRRKDGSPYADGPLLALADRSIESLTGADIRQVYDQLLTRGQSARNYAMACLKAVLNWYGVEVPGSPFSKSAPGRERIQLAARPGRPRGIPREYLGAWWRAANQIDGSRRRDAGGVFVKGAGLGGTRLAADYYQFRLLTGTRECEVLGDNFGNEPMRVKDYRQMGGRILVRNTKNRKDLTLLLSRQAVAIIERNIEGKKPDDPIFVIGDGRKTLQAINRAAGMDPLAVSGHGLRATFASIADVTSTGYTLKMMINHATGNDVTANHYIYKDEEQLRAGWQAVADFIEKAALPGRVIKGKFPAQG